MERINAHALAQPIAAISDRQDPTRAKYSKCLLRRWLREAELEQVAMHPAPEPGSCGSSPPADDCDRLSATDLCLYPTHYHSPETTGASP